MKPGFALLFSMDGVSLLRRAGSGWQTVGTISATGEDPAAALAELRAAGEAFGEPPLMCKLVIPDEHIRYLAVETGAADADTRLAAAQQALEGATPYALEELAYDLSAAGPVTHVAAVAIETLAEAESFALENGFLPASFVAAPDAGTFAGEPFFGTARAIRGTEIEPESIPVTAQLDTVPEPEAAVAAQDAAGAGEAAQEIPALLPEAPSENAVPDAAQAEDTIEPVELPEEPDAAAEEDNARETADAAGAAAPAEPDAEPEVQTEDITEDTAAADSEQPVQEEAAAEDTPGAAEDQAASADTGDKAAAQADSPLEDKAEGTPGRDAAAPVENAPAPADAETVKLQNTDDDSAPPSKPELRAEPRSEAAKDTPIPIAGFSSRRSKPLNTGAKPAPAVFPLPPASASAAASLSPQKPAAEAAKPDLPVLKPAAPRPGSGIPAAPPPLAGIPPKPAKPALSGERKPAPAAKPAPAETAAPAGKPRLAVMMGVLLAVLAAVALWSAFVPAQDTEDAAVQPPETAEPAVLPADAAAVQPAEAPEVVPALPEEAATVPEAEAGTPTETAEAAETADPAATEDAGSADAELLAEEAQTEVPLDAEPEFPDLSQAALYAATGIWDGALSEPDGAAQVNLSQIYVASIDGSGLSQDAVAITGPDGFTTDTAPQSLPSPAAPGSSFTLDSRGLVEATPEGTMNPDGIMIFLGRPEIAPPPPPARGDAEAETAAAAAEEAVRRAVLAETRPRIRPGNLVESAERARFGGLTRAELAAVRPRIRPQGLEVFKPQVLPATKEAVEVSANPRPRPSSLARARSTVPAAAPAAVTPSLPTSASVARQATQENAINLRKVNLIGVFGTPSDRRALVRLSSGGYRNVKVGDRLDGGRVVAIGDTELRYQKGGRNLILRMPNG